MNYVSFTMEFYDKINPSARGKPFERRSYLSPFMEGKKNCGKGNTGRESRMDKGLEE